jgi:hypothetical protein
MRTKRFDMHTLLAMTGFVLSMSFLFAVTLL